jgi:hypothetical protein
VGYVINVAILHQPAASLALTAAPGEMLAAIRIMFLVLYAYILARVPGRGYTGLLRVSLCAYTGYIAFVVGVHENHAVLLVVLSALLAAEERRWRLFLAVAAFANVNLLLFYGLDGSPADWPLRVPLTLAIAAVAVGGAMFMISSEVRNPRRLATA